MRKGNQFRCRYASLHSDEWNKKRMPRQPGSGPTLRAPAADTFFPSYYSNKSVLVPLRNAVTEGWERISSAGWPLAPKKRGRWVSVARSSRKQRRELKGAAPRASRIPRVPRQRCQRNNRVPRAALASESDYRSCCFFVCVLSTWMLIIQIISTRRRCFFVCVPRAVWSMPSHLRGDV